MLKHARKPKLKGRKLPTRKCSKVERLFGPVELDILDRKADGARIVLLGDMHTSRKKCPPNTKCGLSIWTYLENLFQQYKSQQYLDFFLELPFADTDDVKGVSLKRATEKKQEILAQDTPFRNYLASIHVYFFNCWQRAKQICEFYRKPIRFHYSDVREGVIHSGSGFEDRLMIQLLRELLQIDNKDVTSREMHLLLTLVDKFITDKVDYFFRLTKIDKQINKITNKELQQSLTQIMTNQMIYFKDFALHVQFFVKEMVQTKMPIVFRNQKNESAFFLTETAYFESQNAVQFTELVRFVIGGLLSPLFDIYTLARMIRLNMKHVIIYAGAMHTQRIKAFLVNHVGFKLTKSVVSKRQTSNFQCINMKGVPQPWFV